MIARLLETKFHSPPWRSDSVARLRLLDRLEMGFSEPRKLLLIVAPPGYGKTTLAAEWLHSFREHPSARRAAWLSLDEGDNDPARFLSYWTASVRRIDANLGQSVQSLLGTPQVPPIFAILDEFINELASLEYDLASVFDDYHVINNPALHEALEYFLEHQPPQMHLVILSRADPALPLARMRARGQITEIRAHDLRFTGSEAQQFFNQYMHLQLETNAIHALELRTEGWVAGMQLAALALQNLPEQQDFLAEFSGSHRYIIDYLVDEVLKHQSPEIREFLGKTAILKRFNAHLCQAVSGNPDSAAILEHLERANLFLTPLDDQRGWYRYHHLFAEALRANLATEIGRQSYFLAARWLESQGLYTEAISCWLAATDFEQAARLIRTVAVELLKNGELQTLLGWISALPDDMVRQDAELASYYSLLLLLTGQLNQAQEYVARLDDSIESQPRKPGMARLRSLQAWFAMTIGGAQARQLSQQALDELDESDSFFRAVTLISLGNSYAWEASLPDSSRAFREAYHLGKQMHHPFITLGALANLAFNLLDQGSLLEAEALCHAALSEYVDSRGHPLPVLGIIYIPLASIYYEKGDFDQADMYARRGMDLCQRLFSSAIMGGDGEITLVRVAFQRRQPEKAFELLDTFIFSARQRKMMFAVYKMMIVRVELYLLLGQWAEAEMRLAELETLELSNLPKTWQVIEHLKARLWVGTNQADRALEVLGKLENEERNQGCTRRLISILITRALALQKQGHESEALLTIKAALQLAAPEGYQTVFYPHNGRPTLPLLSAARSFAPEFIGDILKKFPLFETPPLPQAHLVDPLSEQELRVLRLITLGKSNQEIAAELFISVGTAKWHVHNILRKLDVSTRSQAIHRARELGL